MTESHVFFACRQSEEEKMSTKFSIGCGAQRLLRSYSVIENNMINWKCTRITASLSFVTSWEILR